VAVVAALMIAWPLFVFGSVGDDSLRIGGGKDAASSP